MAQWEAPLSITDERKPPHISRTAEQQQEVPPPLSVNNVGKESTSGEQQRSSKAWRVPSFMPSLLLAYAVLAATHAVIERVASWQFCFMARAMLVLVVWDLVLEPMQAWWCDFSRRKHRWETECPSHVRRPDTGARELTAQSPRRLSADSIPRFGSGRKLSSDVPNRLSPLDRLKRLHSATAFITRSGKKLGASHASHLPANWDHLPLALTELLWARIFVYVPLAVQSICGMLSFVSILVLRRTGLVAAPRHDARRMCFKLLLETSCAVFVAVVEAEGSAPPHIATFTIPWAAKVLENGDVQLGELSGDESPCAHVGPPHWPRL